VGGTRVRGREGVRGGGGGGGERWLSTAGRLAFKSPAPTP